MDSPAPNYYDLNLLVPGRCYFLVAYYDNAAIIPIIETYIFAGKNLLPGDEDLKEIIWYFQEPAAYLKFGLFSSASQTTEGIMLVENGLLEATLKDFDTLQDWLAALKNRAPN